MNYDIILINVFTRFQPYYFPILKYLGKNIKIGLIDAIIPRVQSKLSDTQERFNSLCIKYGAIPITIEDKPSCSLMILPQTDYKNNEKLSAIFKNVNYKKLIIANTFGYGLDFIEDISTLGIYKFLVWDYQLLQKKIHKNKNAEKIIKDIDLEVMGSPFKSYPIFPEIEFDYVIALPSQMGMDNRADQLMFIENVLAILEKIGESRIVLKPHNVKDGGNNLFFHPPISLLIELFTEIAKIFSTKAKNIDEKILLLKISAAYRKIFKRVKLFQEVTDYFNLNLELFLPSIKNGLITGNSATIWFALCNRLPVYNCGKPFSLIKGETLKENMECFGVQPCNGELYFNEENFNKLSDEVRNADLIEILKREL